jgi:hypothetical protein
MNSIAMGRCSGTERGKECTMAGLDADCKCVSIEDDDPYLQQPESQRPPLESLEATFSDGGDEIMYYTGYSALQIAARRAQEIGGHIYTNNISPQITRRDLNRPVDYAVSKTPVYTLMPPDEESDRIFRCYWPLYRP